jgi:protein ImuB
LAHSHGTSFDRHAQRAETGTMFAVLHISDFALHAVLRTEPAVSRPAALFADTSKKSIVLAINPEARAAGVELGMSAPQAVARCPALIIRSPQPAAEAEARAALLAIGFTLSPLIEDTAPGVCTADLKGTDAAKVTGNLEHAVAELARLSLPATGGLAATPLLALYAARSLEAQPLPLEHGVVAESPPPPVRHVTEATPFLAPLPLATANPSPELAGVLAGWGLRTLGDLTALPRDEIVRRFGAEGLALWIRASGGALRPLRPVTPPQTFAATLELENEVETLEPLLFILRRFLERLALELRASQHVAAELMLALRLEDDTTHERSFRLPEPTADVEILFRALHTHLESLTTGAAITAVSLQLTPARPLVRQQDLFETGLRDPHGFAETLARVSVLVGPERLGTPELEDTHRPDAVRLATPPAVVPPPTEPPLHPPLGAPLRRFRPPVPARIEFTAGRATYLWTEHLSGEITEQSAEYPGSGDWWQQDRAWARTEWDITLAGGGLYRLLLVGESYFLEGEYD